MFMTNKVFVDSSVLIEPLQNRKVDFYVKLVSNRDYLLCINSIVVSEYLYKYIGLQNLGSPRNIQEKNKMADALQPYFITNTLEEFMFVEANNVIASLAPSFMAKYNLLPNDAIILATCKVYNIARLASHDQDFIQPCIEEQIELLRGE